MVAELPKTTSGKIKKTGLGQVAAATPSAQPAQPPMDSNP
jgi:acyl-coenzyme A synthetase/AMP-(fatty) acid ligase